MPESALVAAIARRWLASMDNVPPGASERIEKERCPDCNDPVETWWSYCPMCGSHLAAIGTKKE